MATDTFSISAAGNHGSGTKLGGTWYPTTLDSTEDGTNGYLVVGKAQSDQYYANDAFLRWDTSSISDAATITSARLIVYITEKGDDSGTYALVGEYFDYGGNPVVAGDVTETADPSIFTELDLGSGLTAAAVNNIDLTDLTGINKSGYTGIRLTLTSGSPPSSNDNYLLIASLQAAQQEPRLEVTYTAGGTDATVTAAVATSTAASVAPPKPRPTAPFSEINVRM